MTNFSQENEQSSLSMNLSLIFQSATCSDVPHKYLKNCTTWDFWAYASISRCVEQRPLLSSVHV